MHIAIKPMLCFSFLRYLCGAATLALPFNLRSAFMCDIAMINEPTFPDILGSLFRFCNSFSLLPVQFYFICCNGFPFARSALSDHIILFSNLNLWSKSDTQKIAFSVCFVFIWFIWYKYIFSKSIGCHSINSEIINSHTIYLNFISNLHTYAHAHTSHEQIKNWR